MAIHLVTTKCVADRDAKNASRSSGTHFIPSSGRTIVTEDDEVNDLKRGILMIMLTGLLPFLLFLCLHIFFPGLLSIELTPKEDFTANPQEVDSSIDEQPRIAGHDRH